MAHFWEAFPLKTSNLEIGLIMIEGWQLIHERWHRKYNPQLTSREGILPEMLQTILTPPVPFEYYIMERVGRCSYSPLFNHNGFSLDTSYIFPIYCVTKMY